MLASDCTQDQGCLCSSVCSHCNTSTLSRPVQLGTHRRNKCRISGSIIRSICSQEYWREFL